MPRLFLICVFLILSTSAEKPGMSCSYGGRGSLTSICTNANADYFRKSSYRFDNLDETVICVNCSLHVLPSGSFDLSGNQIKHLELQNSQISILKPRAFIGLVFLESLNLESNLISLIPAETFVGVTKIRKIRANYNLITSLVANAFKGLNNLVTLELNNNKISSIESGAFNGLDSLRILDLSKNAILNVHNIFTTPTKILHLNLEDNKISEFDPVDFKYLNYLIMLLAPQNSIKLIKKNTFSSIFQLQFVNLSSNPMEMIETGGLHGLSFLDELDLSNCLLTGIQKGLFASLHNLRVLDLSRNRLATFRTGMFSGLPELRVLNVSHNKIKRYERTGIQKLPNLHKLDLSFNELRTINYKSLIGHLPALSYLDLQENSLSCFLKTEMEEMFKEDNFKFNLGSVQESNDKCIASTLDDDDDRKPYETGTTERLAVVVVRDASEHEYILYVFIVFSIVVIAILFYMHRRDRVFLERMLQTDSYEAPLISN